MRRPDQPTRLNDPILALRWDYFFPCEVMRAHLLEEKSLFLASEEMAVRDRCLVYLSYWLSSLWVVAHAFRHILKLSGDKRLDELIDLNFRKLSDFRNATYHYHRSPAKHIAFYASVDAMEWAEELHLQFREYFYAYEAGLASFFPDASDEGPLWRQALRSIWER
jgi:hypothetical protein